MVFWFSVANVFLMFEHQIFVRSAMGFFFSRGWWWNHNQWREREKKRYGLCISEPLICLFSFSEILIWFISKDLSRHFFPRFSFTFAAALFLSLRQWQFLTDFCFGLVGLARVRHKANRVCARLAESQSIAIKSGPFLLIYRQLIGQNKIIYKRKKKN